MTDVKSYIKESVLKEQHTSGEVSSIVNDIISEISNATFSGVTRISRNISIVKLSDLQKSIWSPEYYIPAIQSDYVRQYLEKTSTFTTLYNKLNCMVQDRAVKMQSNYYRLNDEVVEILREYI